MPLDVNPMTRIHTVQTQENIAAVETSVVEAGRFKILHRSAFVANSSLFTHTVADFGVLGLRDYKIIL